MLLLSPQAHCLLWLTLAEVMAAILLASPEPGKEEPQHCQSEEALEVSRATSHQKRHHVQDWIRSATALSIPASETSADWDPATPLDSPRQHCGTCLGEMVSRPSLNLPGHNLLLLPLLRYLTLLGDYGTTITVTAH